MSILSERDALMARIGAELDRAYAKHGRDPWGRHEFYAVLKEEVDELWDAIKSDAPDADLLPEIIQVAAMCFRYVETGDRYRGPAPFASALVRPIYGDGKYAIRGCDAPDWMADEILGLRAQLAEANRQAASYLKADKWNDEMCRRMADELAEAKRDTERLDWLEEAVPSGRLRQAAEDMTTWSGTVRSLIDALRTPSERVGGE